MLHDRECLAPNVTSAIEAAQSADSAKRRSLLELVSETRSRAVRVALFGALLHRPDPDGWETEADRENGERVLRDTVLWLGRTHRILTEFSDPWGEYSPEMCRWFEPYIKAMPEIVAKIERLADLSDQVVQGVEMDSLLLGEALRKHHAFRKDGFMPLISRFCDSVWRDFEPSPGEAILYGSGRGDPAQDALERIETLSMNMRLVAMNAAIEAKALGGLGDGLASAVSELQSMAEDLQEISASARADITAKCPAPARPLI